MLSKKKEEAKTFLSQYEKGVFRESKRRSREWLTLNHPAACKRLIELKFID